MKTSRMLLWRVMRQTWIWLFVLLFGMLLRTANVDAATPGDVCGSANVDIADALCTLKYVVGLIPHDSANDTIYMAADVAPLDTVSRKPKGNTNVDISDALGILRHAVNLDTWFNLATSLTGTAAAGAPIVGSVTIKDSSLPAITKTVPIEADGKYMVDVSDMTAPYMVRADGYVGGNEYHLYSAGTSADMGGNINVTPLTDLIVANIAKTVASDYFNNGNFSGLTAAQLTEQSDALKTKLLPVLQAAGVSDSIDLLRASFSTDHTALDAALDVLRVTTDTNTGIATITNIINQQQMTSNAITGTYAGVLDGTGVAAGVTDIQAISAGFKQFSDLFSAGLPSESNPTLLGLFDSDTFLFQGQNLASFLSEITTGQEMVGISFTNISILSMDTEAGTALVAFDVFFNGKLDNDGPKPFHMIRKADGKWYMQGDKNIAHVNVEPVAEYRLYNNTSQIVSGMRFNVEDRGGKGITSAVVTGAGLPVEGVTIINNIANDYFEIQGQMGGNHYAMTDTAIGALADTGEVYTVKLYIGATLAATYTEVLKKRPYLITELSPASFPTITSPTLAQLQAFTGGNATITWTLPDGLTNDWLSAQVNDYSGNLGNPGNSAKAEFSIAPADRSKSFTLNPITINGEAFSITNGWIWLGAWDSYGRQFGVSMSMSGGSNPPPQNNSYVSIEGNVYASAGRINPIAGAVVSTSLDAQTATTDAFGHFILKTSTPANYSTTPYTIMITNNGVQAFSQLLNWGDNPTGQTFNLDGTFGI